MNPKLSPTMVFALEFAREHGGKLVRHQGGFWADPNFSPSTGKEWFGAKTVEGLVERGYMRYSANRQNSRGSFPIEAELIENPLTLTP